MIKKEKRYIVVEVEVEVEVISTDFGDDEYLVDFEWERLHSLKDLLDNSTYGWVTNVSNFKKEVK